MNAEDVRRWTGTSLAAAGAEGHLALAAAVENLWNDWRTRAADRPAGSGRRVIHASGARITVVWKNSGERLTALVAGPAFIERQWLAKTKPALDRQRMHVELVTARDIAGTEARRAAVETGLPWDVVVGDIDPQGELTRIAERRTLSLWGLALLMTVTAGGIVIITRTVVRELAVARLQSDFVSAVSHEFRTPLTSLRQLTEVCSRARWSPTTGARPTTVRSRGRPSGCTGWWRACSTSAGWRRARRRTASSRSTPCALVRAVVERVRARSAARGVPGRARRGRHAGRADRSRRSRGADARASGTCSTTP